MPHSKVVTTKKGKKGMTTYYIRGSLIWINYYVDGKRMQKSTKLKNTPQNIKVVISQIIPALDIKIATGEIYKKKPKTFEYYGSIFLKQKESNKSFWMKRHYFYRVIDYFRGQDINKITRLDVKEYLISLNMKSKSKAEYRNCAKEIFELAVDDGVINFNPALSIKLKSDTKEPIQFYSKEEVNKLLSVATGIMKPYLLIAFNTGMRVGEILGLQLGDFNDDGYIHIKRTRSKGYIGTGKTNNAIRKVPYPAFILDEVRKIQTNHIFIFGNIDDASLLRSQWKDVNDNAGLTKRKLYSTRHTFATLMLKENIVSINELAGLLGHSSPKVTLEHYASVIDTKNIDLGADFTLFCSSSCDKMVTIEKEKAN